MITEERVERMLFKIKKETVMMLTVSFFVQSLPKREKDSRGAAFFEKVYYWGCKK